MSSSIGTEAEEESMLGLTSREARWQRQHSSWVDILSLSNNTQSRTFKNIQIRNQIHIQYIPFYFWLSDEFKIWHNQQNCLELWRRKLKCSVLGVISDRCHLAHSLFVWHRAVFTFALFQRNLRISFKEILEFVLLINAVFFGLQKLF